MIISYGGAQSVKISFGEIVLAFDPVSRESKFRASNFGADIALVSSNHADFNGIATLTRGDKVPFLIAGPGEYEFHGISIKGLPSATEYGGEKHINTIYAVQLEGMRICFLGGLFDLNLPTETKAEIGGVDILFVPVGAKGTLGPSEAYRLAVALEAAVVIPLDWDEATLKTFLKEGGSEKLEMQDKITLKKKDLDGKECEIVVLRGS